MYECVEGAHANEGPWGLSSIIFSIHPPLVTVLFPTKWMLHEYSLDQLYSSQTKRRAISLQQESLLQFYEDLSHVNIFVS